MNGVLPLTQELPSVDPSMMETAKRLEAFETPAWAIEAILDAELLSKHVFDPCAGTGSITSAVRRRGYICAATDIHDWGFPLAMKLDWLSEGDRELGPETTVIMNPPFSLACEFVDKAFELGARKIVCFQRFAWWESGKRREWWQKRPPNRVYICGDRAPCWRFDIPQDERKSSSPTAHAWFVWEAGQPPGTALGHVFRRPA